MQNKEVIVDWSKAEELYKALGKILENKNTTHIKINLTDTSIRLTPHIASEEITLCSN